MTFTVLLFASRKPNSTPTEFRDYFENKHIPLLRSICGDTFPSSYTRHYTAQAESDTGFDPVVLVGDKHDVTWDVLALCGFEDQAQFQQYGALVSEPDTAKRIAKDLENFADGSKTKLVVSGETVST
jgi:hypothetical protein